ncbi:hypothetical protein RR48_05220 [Papilio machaon]|uniref:Uncharacterized protein n=1 Tax=Papilio machaon TaxID=76193 RepID=A0A0N1I915_PAPMA|nr:hypothetical protein RR48_05220 [Papilio machaon]
MMQNSRLRRYGHERSRPPHSIENSTTTIPFQT